MLNPMIATVAISFSSVSVIINVLRLRWPRVRRRPVGDTSGGCAVHSSDRMNAVQLFRRRTQERQSSQLGGAVNDGFLRQSLR